MIDRKTLKKGDTVWLGEMYCGKPRVERATVRQKPRGRGGVWLAGCSRMLASEYQLFPTEEDAYRRIHESAQEALQMAQEEAVAAEFAWTEFRSRTSDADAARKAGL